MMFNFFNFGVDRIGLEAELMQERGQGVMASLDIGRHHSTRFRQGEPTITLVINIAALSEPLNHVGDRRTTQFELVG